MIRLAKLEDCSRMAEIYVYGWRTSYLNIFHEKFLFSEFLVSNLEGSFYATIQKGLENIYVFEEDSIIKGFVSIIVNDPRVNDVLSLEIRRLYVEPFFQGKSIGTKMLDFCSNIAYEFNKEIIFLWSFKENIAAQKFYNKNGFFFDGQEGFIEQLQIYEIRYRKTLF